MSVAAAAAHVEPKLNVRGFVKKKEIVDVRKERGGRKMKKKGITFQIRIGWSVNRQVSRKP
jgi:hypothetical protein